MAGLDLSNISAFINEFDFSCLRAYETPEGNCMATEAARNELLGQLEILLNAVAGHKHLGLYENEDEVVVRRVVTIFLGKFNAAECNYHQQKFADISMDIRYEEHALNKLPRLLSDLKTIFFGGAGEVCEGYGAFERRLRQLLSELAPKQGFKRGRRVVGCRGSFELFSQPQNAVSGLAEQFGVVGVGGGLQGKRLCLLG